MMHDDDKPMQPPEGKETAVVWPRSPLKFGQGCLDTEADAIEADLEVPTFRSHPDLVDEPQDAAPMPSFREIEEAYDRDPDVYMETLIMRRVAMLRSLAEAELPGTYSSDGLLMAACALVAGELHEPPELTGPEHFEVMP